jgi:hypothetical protein
VHQLTFIEQVSGIIRVMVCYGVLVRCVTTVVVRVVVVLRVVYGEVFFDRIII